MILAPVGRDADAIAHVLADMGLPSAACGAMNELCRALSLDTPVLIVTEEGLAGQSEHLTACLDDQPAWSDLPLILLSAAGVRRGGDERWRLFEKLGNVTILARPLHVGALRSAVRSALRGRRRQYDARDYLRELESARSDLEQRIAERTSELEQQMAERRQAELALARAQRMEAIGQLTGGVAHDFNNLLQVIIGGISVLERRGADAERRSAVLDAMRQASERGAKLTQQLLAFARRQALTPETVDAAVRIKQMEDLLCGSVRADLQFELQLAPDAWPVKVDVTQLDVAILNLIVNARDATGPGGRITLSLDNLALPAESAIEGLAGDFARISVRDTGAGMDEATLRRAVEPFFTTKPLGLGTGLGLSQVYGFARQSGGDVQIESAPGQGTTVSVFLPRSSEALRTEEDSPSRGVERPAGGRILVVEDEDQVAELACEVLHDLGFECERVGDAEAALQVDMNRFAAVLSDVVMPGRMDGVALAQELRRLHPRLPILLTTGFAGAPERIAQAGFPVLPKPYSSAQLSDALQALAGDRAEAPREAAKSS